MNILKTPIAGLLVIETETFSDERGWFMENFQREKLIALGFPEDFQAAQINFVQNQKRGVLRGIHAEPWQKYVSIIKGEAFGAYVDLRAGEGFGTVHTVALKPGVAVFIPQGVGNSYQTLQDDTYYIYAVSGHWKPETAYVGLNAFDPALAIAWPIASSASIMSDKDKQLPNLSEVHPWITEK